VATGPEGQLGGESASPNVESEYRFYAALWLAYGAVALRLAPRVEREPALLSWLRAVLFAAGVARAIGWAAAGRPDDLYLVLLALELTIPPALLLGARRNRPDPQRKAPAPRGGA
jgi:hypothetical protein